MHSKRTTGAFWTTVITGVLIASIAMTADPPAKTANNPTGQGTANTEENSGAQKNVSVETARDRAKLTHTICCAMLDVIHDNYFRHERSVVPAVAMEDAFPRIANLENVGLRWITVNGKTMNVDHDPDTEFEKKAAKAIAAGKEAFESVDQGIYRRAKGISLMNNGCLTCHLGFGSSGRINRFSGFIVSIPVIVQQDTDGPGEQTEVQ